MEIIFLNKTAYVFRITVCTLAADTQNTSFLKTGFTDFDYILISSIHIPRQNYVGHVSHKIAICSQGVVSWTKKSFMFKRINFSEIFIWR
jgi:hypothetical protein